MAGGFSWLFKFSRLTGASLGVADAMSPHTCISVSAMDL